MNMIITMLSCHKIPQWTQEEQSMAEIIFAYFAYFAVRFINSLNELSSITVPSALIGVMPAAMQRHVIHVWRKPYVCATSTGATVDVDAPSRGVTLGVHPRLIDRMAPVERR
ncbi:MAG: hypothetical protein J5U17_03180 [Candidatus Methanoperedens sp.]|nr:hypothetical protein [Candidatus Methanoperedens sp.]MCE8429157.1 hypothetical protein [Candidatus Methanoperedens sp.]